MNARRFAKLQASFAAQPDIHAEIAVLLSALEPEPKREIPVLPVAAAIAVIVGSAGQALAEQAQHVVVAGESLYRIAARELGSGSRWPEIARLNHLADPARIMVGQVLQMPITGASDPHQELAGRSGVSPDAAAVRPVRATSLASAASLDRIAEPAATAHQLPVEIVPAGVVVERLPGRSQADLPPSARPTSSSPAEPGPQESPGWMGLDGLAFVAGAVAGLRLLGRTRKQRSAPKLRVVTAPMVEEAVSDSFWNTPPGSWDLQNLTASAS